MRLGACCACACILIHRRALDADIRRWLQPRIDVIAARPENDHDPYHHPQSRRDAGRAAVFPSSTSSSVPATGSGLSPPTVAAKPPCCVAWRALMEASEGEITRSRGLTVGYVEQDVPEALMDRPLHAAVLETLSADRQLSERWRVDVALESARGARGAAQTPLKHLSGGWQRLAMLARVLVTEADVLLLDEPTNHLDLARIGQLENWLNALPREMPVVICQPRPRLSRCDHEPDAVPAAGAVAGVFIALYAGARRTSRGRRIGRAALSARPEDRPATSPAGGEAQQHRHQLRQRPAVVEDQAIEAARREAGRCGKAGPPRTIRRHDQACQSRNARQGSGHAG